MAAAAPPGLAAAGMLVDEESPAARLVRLEDELDEVDDPTSVEYLLKNAEVAKQRWIVARKAVCAAKDEKKQANEEGDDDKKAAAAEKVELAGAEAELAGAKAELAQAKAKGMPTEALNNKVASFNTTVERLKTQHPPHPPPPLAGERPAKRLRLDVKASRVRSASVAVLSAPGESQLLGRKAAINAIRQAVQGHYRYHCKDKAFLPILAAVGHVRVGKTRLGREVARIVEVLRTTKEEYAHWTAPVYLKVDFQNGSSFSAALDGEALDDRANTNHASHLLGARLAVAAKALFLDGAPAEVERCSFDHLRGVDVRVGAVVEQLVDELLARADNPEKACVPVVIHVDEYGYYVNAAKGEERREMAKAMIAEMARRIGTELMMANGVKNEALRTKFFVMPIFTGTSYNDLRLRVSGFPVRYLPLPLLSFQQSRELLADFWRQHRPGTEMPGPDTPTGNALLIALSDAGGFPGFVEMLAELNDQEAEQSAPASLSARMKDYARNVPEPPVSLWSALVRLVLAREPLVRGDTIVYTGRGNQSCDMTVGEALDRGYVSKYPEAGEADQGGGWLKLAVPMGVVRIWSLEAGVFDLMAVPDPTPNSPWTWQQFEIMHANFVASVLAALFRVGGLIGRTPAAPVTLRRLLRGAEPAGAPPPMDGATGTLLGQLIVGGPRELPWGDAARGIVHETRQVFSRVRNADKVSLEMDGVHLCADGNHVVDAYVNLELQGERGDVTNPATVFFQYKHSKLAAANSPLALGDLNSERQRLDNYLRKRQKSVWRNRQVVLVFVTNREVRAAAGEKVGRGLLYVSDKQLSRHLGPELAGRGLVPTATARREQ